MGSINAFRLFLMNWLHKRLLQFKPILHCFPFHNADEITIQGLSYDNIANQQTQKSSGMNFYYMLDEDQTT